MSSKFVLAATCLIAFILPLSGCSDSEDAPPPVERESVPPPQIGGEPPAGAMTPEDATRNALIGEYQQIQQRLGQVQQEAMADTELQGVYAALEAHIEEQMLVTDPGYAENRDKLLALQEEMSAAQQTGDEQAIQAIATQGNALQGEIQQLQAKVIQGEQIAAEVLAFRQGVEVKMQEIDPETPKLLERIAEITEILQASTKAQSGG